MELGFRLLLAVLACLFSWGGGLGPVWAKLMDTKNAYTAEMWKELLNGEALSVRVIPASGWAKASELEPHAIYVPWGKLHVAQEILRKI